MSFKIGWYVLYVKSRWEKKVHKCLEDMKLESFLPQVKTIRVWSDRKKVIFKPLFPSYVFVNINCTLELHKAISINGACAYVRFGNEYAYLTENEINHIRLLIADKNISNIETSSVLPKIGETKKITYGPLNGLNCEIVEINNVNKIIVRLESLHQNIIATIPLYSFGLHNH